jgi:hypothetical protein
MDMFRQVDDTEMMEAIGGAGLSVISKKKIDKRWVRARTSSFHVPDCVIPWMTDRPSRA